MSELCRLGGQAAGDDHHERRRPGGDDERQLDLDGRKGSRARPPLLRRRWAWSPIRWTASPGDQFPGQTAFSPFAAGNTLPGPTSALGSVLVHTNVSAPDGDPSEAVGSITFGAAPSEFAFTANDDFQEHNLLVVPAGGAATLSYVYSVGYTVADVTGMALAAQDAFEPLSVVIGTPAGGTSMSTATDSVRHRERGLRDHVARRRGPAVPRRAERGVDGAGPAQPGHEHDHRARHRRRGQHPAGAGARSCTTRPPPRHHRPPSAARSRGPRG